MILVDVDERLRRLAHDEEIPEAARRAIRRVLDRRDATGARLGPLGRALAHAGEDLRRGLGSAEAVEVAARECVRSLAGDGKPVLVVKGA